MTRFPESSGKTHVAFMTLDRASFFQEWWLGLRFRTVRFEGVNPVKRPSPFLDVMIGQNERITGGQLDGVALRFDGFFPFPWGISKVGYLFAQAQIRMDADDFAVTPLILKRVTGIDVPGPDVAIVPLPPINKDWWRVGVGVNLFEILALLD